MEVRTNKGNTMHDMWQKTKEKETLKRTQGLTINQTTMMQMTSNEYNMKDWKQTNIARKQMFETNHGLLRQGS